MKIYIVIFSLLFFISSIISISGFFCAFNFSLIYTKQKYSYCLPIPYKNQTNNNIDFNRNIKTGIPAIIIGSLYLIILLPATYIVFSFYRKKKKESLLVKIGKREKYLKLLYFSHFLSSWGDRMWQFAIPVILMIIFKNTFIPTAIYSIIIYVGNILAMPWIGKWIDENNRFQVQIKSIIIENLMIILSSLIICIFSLILNIDKIDKIFLLKKIG